MCQGVVFKLLRDPVKKLRTAFYHWVGDAQAGYTWTIGFSTVSSLDGVFLSLKNYTSAVRCRRK